MSDTANQPPKEGSGKMVAAFLAAFSASYIMTQMSLRGVDFETLGVSSEIVKSAIIAHLVGFFVWLTPKNLVSFVTDCIVFVKTAIKQWRNAANSE